MPRVLTLTAAVLAAGLGGCGAATTVAPGSEAVVGLTEYRITPQHLRARAGEISILARNDGRLAHSLIISLSGHELAGTAPIPPGASARLVLLLAPGSYAMASDLFSDQALGTSGTLTVTR